jgi:DNA replication protein DnaC
VIYRRLPRLFADLALAHADGSYIAVLGRLARVDVLVLDDSGLGTVTDRPVFPTIPSFSNRSAAGLIAD